MSSRRWCVGPLSSEGPRWPHGQHQVPGQRAAAPDPPVVTLSGDSSLGHMMVLQVSVGLGWDAVVTT